MTAPVRRKLSLATTSLAGCFGCHMSLLDIDERIFELVELYDLRRSPLDDIKALTGQALKPDLGSLLRLAAAGYAARADLAQWPKDDLDELLNRIQPTFERNMERLMRRVVRPVRFGWLRHKGILALPFMARYPKGAAFARFAHRREPGWRFAIL